MALANLISENAVVQGRDSIEEDVMVEARKRRTILVVGIILASLLLFGCDFFDGFASDPGPRQGESAYPNPYDDTYYPPDEAESEQSADTAPSDQEDGALTGAQDGPATGPITAGEIAGTYSESAVLSSVVADVEAEKNIPVTVQLNENGTGTATVDGYSGAAQFSGTSVSFSVTMEEGGQSVVCSYKGVAARSQDGSQMAITGTMNCSMMGVTFAYYDWTAYK
ncbi:MAG TPA: hypothetical protein DCP20_07745 [Coriobacteriia bacterium]|nr:hypothetical protein [Coriobacteriia bacterium]